MVRHKVLCQVTYQGRKLAPFARVDGFILKETYLEEGDPTDYKGDEKFLVVGKYTGSNQLLRAIMVIYNPISELQINTEDVVGLKLKFYCTLKGTAPDAGILKAKDLDTLWDEAYATWDWKFAGEDWDGKGAEEGIGGIFAAQSLSISLPTWYTLDFLPKKAETEISFRLEGREDAVIDDEWVHLINGRENILTANQPKLVIDYYHWSPESFESEDKQLSIVPNELNPVQPKLTWGKIDVDAQFTAFKIYRKTSAFYIPSDATLEDTITDPSATEWVDTDVLTGDTQYFYMVTTEGTYNTGNDATYSNLASFKTPKVMTTVFSSVGIGVGNSKTVSFTTNKLFVKYRIDWDDGTVSWYENDISGTSGSISHIYYSSGSRVPKVMFEDLEGFWSLEQAVAAGCIVSDSTPIAFLDVGQKRVKEGNKVYLNASMSAPLASNGTITKFMFKRFVGDTPWIDNGTNPILEVDTTGFSAANKTATVEITTAGGTALAYADYTVYVEVIENFGLTRYSTINSIVESQSFNIDSGVPIGSDGETEFESLMGKQLMRISVNGKTSRGGLALDIDRIRSLYGNRTVFRITSTTFKRGTTVTWIGKIEGEPSFNHSTPNLITWDLTLKVMERIPSV